MKNTASESNIIIHNNNNKDFVGMYVSYQITEIADVFMQKHFFFFTCSVIPVIASDAAPLLVLVPDCCERDLAAC